jgi:hypothetical protein
MFLVQLKITADIARAGKCGARNRKTLQDAPKLEYVHPDATAASVLVWFPNCTYPVKLPIQKVLILCFLMSGF